VSGGLDDQDVGSGDGSHVRVTGGKGSCLRIVFDFSELSQFVHTVSLPGQALQMLPMLSSFFIGTTNCLSVCLLRVALWMWIFVCHSFNGLGGGGKGKKGVKKKKTRLK